MKGAAKNVFLAGLVFALAYNANAHDLPLSYVDLRIGADGIEVTLQSSAKNFARELPGTEEAKLLDPAGIEELKDRLLAHLSAGLSITENGQTMSPRLRQIEPLPARRDLRIVLDFPSAHGSHALQVRCKLFASDPRHRTFLNIYEGETLRSQDIFDRDTVQIDYAPGGSQSTLTVVRQFLYEGVHHIFIGPDHILFIIGLLLLGGSITELLKIVTAFTIAHSVTLVLATLNILTPPPRLIEPAIALSIVFVGAHAMMRERGDRAWRLLFAFCFGFVHGFGFANVLREMELPRSALGWSLFSFNAGVEIGQACIVLAVAPLLALIHRQSVTAARKVVTASSFAVVMAGSYWFVQRLFPTP